MMWIPYSFRSSHASRNMVTLSLPPIPWYHNLHKCFLKKFIISNVTKEMLGIVHEHQCLTQLTQPCQTWLKNVEWASHGWSSFASLSRTYYVNRENFVIRYKKNTLSILCYYEPSHHVRIIPVLKEYSDSIMKIW